MHITEGILPAKWALTYGGVAGVFLAKGLYDLKRKTRENLRTMPFTAIFTAAVFIISLMPIPVPIGGTSSHPGGTPLAAVFMGPFLTIVISTVALLFQALFFAHGGLTTLGANIITLGICGGFTGWAVYRLSLGLKFSRGIAAGLAGFLGDLAIYLGASLQMALALHGHRPVFEVFLTFFTLYLPVQFPLALLEGVFTGFVVHYIYSRRPEFFQDGGFYEA